jgi:hypothetical protein
MTSEEFYAQAMLAISPLMVQRSQSKEMKDSTLKAIEEWADGLTELYRKNRDRYRTKMPDSGGESD